MLKAIVVLCLALSPFAADDESRSEVPAPEPSPALVEPERPADERGLDPNYSRLLFGPTGRPLKKGDGYFSDYELVFPGVAFGLTDNVSLAGGLSIIPGLGFDEQVFYVSPRVGWNLGEKASVSVGGLYAAVPADDDLDDLVIGFVVGTFGDRHRSLSVGVGVAYPYLSDGASPAPIVMVGGTVTVSRSVALVSENWLIMADHFDLAEQPFGLGVRFFGDRLSADVGLVIVPANLGDAEGLLPWASITYHFGPGTKARRQGRSR
jgi:hypothetical protein